MIAIQKPGETRECGIHSPFQGSSNIYRIRPVAKSALMQITKIEFTRGFLHALHD